MSRRPRRNHSPAFKAKVALEPARGERTLADLASQFDVYPNLITQWKVQLLEPMVDVFDRSSGSEAQPVDVQALHAMIGELTLENNLTMSQKVRSPRRKAERKEMIDHIFQVSITWKAEMLAISRDSVYFRPRPGERRRPGADAEHGRTTPGVSVCRQLGVVRSAEPDGYPGGTYKFVRYVRLSI